MVFLGVQVTGIDVIKDIFGARNNRKLICIDLNDFKSSNFNSQEDPKDEAFSMRIITSQICQISKICMYTLILCVRQPNH